MDLLYERIKIKKLGNLNIPHSFVKPHTFYINHLLVHVVQFERSLLNERGRLGSTLNVLAFVQIRHTTNTFRFANTLRCEYATVRMHVSDEHFTRLVYSLLCLGLTHLFTSIICEYLTVRIRLSVIAFMGIRHDTNTVAEAIA